MCDPAKIQTSSDEADNRPSVVVVELLHLQTVK
jgi:hypothetical protein